MRQLAWVGPGRLEWRDADEPAGPGPCGAVVRPVAVATCDFDHLIVAGLTPIETGSAIGHECVAEVLAVGSEVDTVRPGDLVIVPYQVSCGDCTRCRAGLTGSCNRVPWLSCFGLGDFGGGFGGAMADRMVVPYADAMLVAAPAGVAPEVLAAMSCNLCDALNTVDAVRSFPGEPVLVAGGAFGSIALFAVQFALALGAGRVDYLDDDPQRCAQAAALGAHLLDPADVPAASYPVTVDAALDVDRLNVLLSATAPGGVCTASTMYPSNAVALPLFTMFQHCLTFRTGQPHVRSLLPTVLDLVAGGRVDPGLLITTVDWDDAPEAFARGRGKTVCLRS